jgi:protein gp37
MVVGMGDTTDIGWCHRTFNGWIGCSAVSPACGGCYAAAQVKRWRGVKAGTDLWRRAGPRSVTSLRNWQKPLRWEREAAAGSPLTRVFASSLADVLEAHPALDAPYPGLAAGHPAAAGPRQALFRLAAVTPNLQWLYLTKRPENLAKMVPPGWLEDWPPNVWVGTSVESRQYTWRAEVLAGIPAAIPVRFLSVEPLIEAVELPLTGIDWVILGGMSGSKWRRHVLQPGWARSVRDQAIAAGASFYFKQWGGLHPKDGGKELDGREWCQIPGVPDLLAA